MDPVRLQPRSPNLSAHLERYMRSLKEECLERMIFFGEKSLQTAAVAYVTHFLRERNHQWVGNQLLIPGEEVGRTSGEIVSRERLGGLLRYYYREATAKQREHGWFIAAAVQDQAARAHRRPCTAEEPNE